MLCTGGGAGPVCGGEPTDPGGVPAVLWPGGAHGQLRRGILHHSPGGQQAVHGVTVGSPQLGLLVILLPYHVFGYPIHT